MLRTQLPTTEVNYLGEGAVNPGVGEDVIVCTSATSYQTAGYGDFYVTLYSADLEFVLNFYNCAASYENFIKDGTYNVGLNSGNIFANSYSKIWFGEGDNDWYEINSGTVVVSEVDGQYKFDLLLLSFFKNSFHIVSVNDGNQMNEQILFTFIDYRTLVIH